MSQLWQKLSSFAAAVAEDDSESEWDESFEGAAGAAYDGVGGSHFEPNLVPGAVHMQPPAESVTEAVVVSAPDQHAVSGKQFQLAAASESHHVKYQLKPAASPSEQRPRGSDVHGPAQAANSRSRAPAPAEDFQAVAAAETGHVHSGHDFPAATISPTAPLQPALFYDSRATPPSPAPPPPPVQPQLEAQVQQLVQQLRVMKKQLDEMAAARRLVQRQAAEAQGDASQARQAAATAATELRHAKEDNSDAARYIMQLEDELHAAKSQQDSVQRSSQAETEAAASAQLALHRLTAQSTGSIEELQRQLQAAHRREAALVEELQASREAEGRLEQLLRSAGAGQHPVQPPPQPPAGSGNETQHTNGLHMADVQARVQPAASGATCGDCVRLRRQLGGRSAKIAALQDELLAAREALVAFTAPAGAKGAAEKRASQNFDGFVPREAIAKLFVMTRGGAQDAADRQVALEMLSSMLELSHDQQVLVGAALPAMGVLPFMQAGQSSGPGVSDAASSAPAGQSLADEWVRFLGDSGQGAHSGGASEESGQP